MKDKHIPALWTCVVASSVVAVLLLVSADKLADSTPAVPEHAGRRIAETEKGPPLVRKEVLAETVEKHLDFLRKLRARDLAYADLTRTLGITLMFLAAIQVTLLFKLQKDCKDDTRTPREPDRHAARPHSSSDERRGHRCSTTSYSSSA